MFFTYLLTIQLFHRHTYIDFQTLFDIKELSIYVVFDSSSVCVVKNNPI